MLLIDPPYQSLLQEDSMKQLIERYQIKLPIGIDRGGAIARAFGLKQLPKFLFLDQGKAVINQDGRQWINGAEIEIQKVLRQEDPGLPLDPPYQTDDEPLCDLESIHLQPPNVDSVQFNQKVPELNAELSRLLKEDSDGFSFYGNFKKQDQGLLIEDSSAFVIFRCRGKRFSLIAKTANETVEKGRITVELDGAPVFDVFIGDHLRTDENGATSIDIKDAQLYHSVRDLPPENQWITLTFPSAHRIPVELFGFRFSD